MTAPMSAEPLSVQLDAQTAAQWRVWTTDLLTGAQLSYQLPVVIDSYSRQANGAGGFSGTVSLDAAEDPVPVMQPRRTALWVARGDALRWGGIIWPVEPDIEARTMKVSASSFVSYYAHRQIRDTLTFDQVDQFDIVRALVDYAHTAQGGNIRVLVDQGASGVLRDRTYDGSEAKGVLDALTELAEVENGFEYTEDVYFDQMQRPQAVIRLGHPRLGTDKGLLFSYPGDVMTYSWPSDPADSVNSVLAVGAGEGSAMLRSVAVDEAELAAGWPLLDGSVSYKDVSDQGTLDAHASEDLAASTGDKMTPTFTVRTGSLGAWSIGDQARFMLTSAYHRGRDGAAGYDGYLRIVGDEVHPGSAEQDEYAVLACDSIRGA